MKSQEIRSTFLEFFRERGHVVLPSSPVIPQGDKTLLFTNAGMVQFKDVFTGREKAAQPRATTVQKCIRAGGKHNDLDNVGYTTRHLTFFEMLGNFSFGDYFKEDAIAFAWDLVRGGFGLDTRRLWVTVYRDDDESRRIWRRVSGLSDARIAGLGEKDNFWSMGDTGPCGPCSEILYDRGEAFGPADLENGERFFEIWNLVFMQFNQAADASRSPLPRPSIDTGMGLERIAMVLQGVDSVFDTDVLRSLMRRIEDLSGVAYEPGERGVPHRVLADHLRSLVFAIADGETPSNSTRGYVLRRILRRAARYGRKLHGEGPILHRLVPDLVRQMGAAYPEIARQEQTIQRYIQSEEELFSRTLDRGIEIFDDVVRRLEAGGQKTVPARDVHLLYTTYGFPADLVERMAAEIGLGVDLAGFEALMEKEREISQGEDAGFASVSAGGDGGFERLPPTRFLGYEHTSAEAEVLAAVQARDAWQVVLSESPFYGESGGQVGDTGSIQCGELRFRVEDTQKEGGRLIHLGTIEAGDPLKLRQGAVVRAQVDEDRRRRVERNHSATHLLHAALRRVLGGHVQQKGSLVEPGRLRFDVSHFSAVSPEELERAQALVRAEVRANIAVETLEMGREEALARGALAFFEEKYGDRVRVVRMGDFSMELCGGTHVKRTGDVGAFAVVHEGSVSSGVRRVEAWTAEEAEKLATENSRLVASLARSLRVTPEKLIERIERLLEENRELKAGRGKAAAAGGGAGSIGGQLEREQLGEVLLVRGLYEGLDGKALLAAYDGFKKEAKKLAVVVVSKLDGGKVQVLVALSPALVKDGLSAKTVFARGAELLGARGGGRDEMVQGSGSAGERAEEAVRAMAEAVRRGVGRG